MSKPDLNSELYELLVEHSLAELLEACEKLAEDLNQPEVAEHLRLAQTSIRRRLPTTGNRV